MRLKAIKLAGFKSFVDPTTLNLPSNLTCVVGPNGCGKSNTIDAVRWVMGESSAKYLRGESMADVIFNGSASRKPVGKASIELVFDNSQRKLGGQYAAFDEIAVKREVTREGASNYYMNGSRCRRKDITDLFLGTGLGPRSYAIIEQGMISRFIEAKPEELRVFIEEAAGISKYKERRRETENRMRHTRENMERLNDLREEVDTQLRKLKRQAEVAERYREFQATKRKLDAELTALRWADLEGDAQKREASVQETAQALADADAGLSAASGVLEQLREEQQQAQDEFNQVQGRFYEVGAEVARAEQALRHARELRERQTEELAQLQGQTSQLQTQLTSDEVALQETREKHTQLAATLAECRQAAELVREQMEAAEEGLHDSQEAWDKSNERSANAHRQSEVERARLDDLAERQRRASQRREKINNESAHLNPQPALMAAAESEASLEILTGELEANQEQLQQLRDEHAAQRSQEQDAQAQLAALRSERAQLEGRISSLETLRDAALSDGSAALNDWLAENQLANSPSVGEQIQVESGWETAVEVVLAPWLQGRLVAELASQVSAASQVGAVLIDQNSAASSFPEGSLAAKVQGVGAASGWLAHVHCADSLAQAQALAGGLQAHESVITADGIWLGPHWLRGVQTGEGTVGVLERERELRDANERLQNLNEQLQLQESVLEQAQAASADIEQQAQAAEQASRGLLNQQQEQQRQLDRQRLQAEQIQQRQQQFAEELSTIAEQQQEDSELERTARGRLEVAVDELEQANAEKQQLEAQRQQSRDRVQQARNELRNARERADDLNGQTQGLQATANSLTSSVSRQQQQLEAARERELTLTEAMASGDEPVVEQQQRLETLLEQRLEVEHSLQQARDGLAGFDSRIREQEQLRAQGEQKINERRSELEQLRLQLQELRVRQQGFLESLAERELTPQAVLETTEPDASASEWRKQLEAVEERIRRLGTVNLAAIEEYKTTSERQQYLEEQNADLTGALETLEAAIAKIDKETRTRFTETFDAINSHLKELFPRLFGGGSAHLELTGDDVLDTGVAILARPPGKRITNIHLMSGGEKALTAVALVFSIFQLNPAPFCMLDEVDAPLDDANVGRFARLVKDLSPQVQFVYISHNKGAMEMAESLVGVTMQEPGVSRLVAVNVDEAMAMTVA